MNSSHRKTLFFFVYFLFCNVLILLQLLREPSIENPFLFGLSKIRFAFAVILAVSCVIFLLFIIGLISKRRILLNFLAVLLKLSEKILCFTFLSSVLFGLIILFSFAPFFRNLMYIERLRPFLSWVFLTCIGPTLFDVVSSKNKPWNTAGRWFVLLEHIVFSIMEKITLGNRYLMIPLIIVFPLIFFPAINYPYPTGFAGLYSLMAESIGAANFRYPNEISFYGPGGLPFAYPPLGFFIMAFFTFIVRIQEFTYLRFAPCIFTWLSVIPLALITYSFTKSKASSILIPVVVATNFHIFYLQTTSGGIVRGLAFLFSLWSVYFCTCSFNHGNKKRFPLLAGIFLGLTTLTHFSYTLFVVSFITANLLIKINVKKTWNTVLLIGAISFCIVSPWFILMVYRHGWSIFGNIFFSHNNNNFIYLLNNPNQIITWIKGSLAPLVNVPFLTGFILIGLINSILSKDKILFLWFLIVLLFTSESDRYLFVIGALLFGQVFAIVFGKKVSNDFVNQSRRVIYGASICTLVFFLLSWTNVTSVIRPTINSDTLAIAQYVQNNTPKDSVFLIVAYPDDAEWFPFLFQRVPAIGHWGSEWLNTYYDQNKLVYRVFDCEEKQSVYCLEEVINEINLKPDMLVIQVKDSSLITELENNNYWKKVYSNKSYQLWFIQ